MHDTVFFESQDRPSLFIISSAFIDAARIQAKGLGLPEVQYLTVPHPIQGTLDEEIKIKADAIVDKIGDLLTAKELNGNRK